MTRKIKFGDVVYISLWIILSASFIAANRVDVKRYSPYQMLVWEIKANEGYRSWWYPDGRARIGNQWRPSHSIGFGWNDYGGTRRGQIKKYTADRKVTYDEAMKITLSEIQSWGQLNPDKYRNLALQLYSYNCGKISSGKQLGKCHGGINVRGKRCGSSDASVRMRHNRRREYELALWNHDWVKIQEFTENNQAHQLKYNVKLKKAGKL